MTPLARVVGRCVHWRGCRRGTSVQNVVSASAWLLLEGEEDIVP